MIMKDSKFNQAEYTRKWDKEHMSHITGKYKKEFVDQFKQACKELGITQSEVFRKAMQETINKVQKNRDDR